MKINHPIDAHLREQALDPTQSFIVQAPAGSGKTELLTQRFLRLLTAVDHPEEVVALTFTRKAAAEMRERIINALLACEQKNHAYFKTEQSQKLAYAVLQKDAAQGWQLLRSPARLRIQTLDAFCARVIGQAPYLISGSATGRITQDIERYYAACCDELLQGLNEEEPWSESLRRVLTFLNHDIHYFQRLIISMLSKREQWLPHLLEPHRESLEISLQTVINEILLATDKHLPADLKEEWLHLCHYAQTHLGISINEIEIFPQAHFSELHRWQHLLNYVFTKENQFKKILTIKDGFPAPSSTKNKDEATLLLQMKQRMLEVIATLQNTDGLLTLLQQIRVAPTPYYTDEQWQLLLDVCDLLLICYARLRHIFENENVCDFAEIQMQALSAFGTEDTPTDLAYRFDTQIKHLLVDEFQDTSDLQFCLLQRLTHDWQPGDGRSLFLVGDPMQSIYSFRAAEVGLFLRAKWYGLGVVKLVSLHLQMNFRAHSALVDWYNHIFSNIFPKQEDIGLGAISYTPAQAIQDIPALEHLHVEVCPADEQTYSHLAQQLKTRISQLPHATIAVLVQSKEHAKILIPYLQRLEVPYQAIDIETLADSAVIQDFMVLIYAITNVADKTHWLALLRAPWCGLLLHDIHLLVELHPHKSVFECMQDEDIFLTLSADAQVRLTKVRILIEQTLDLLAQKPLPTVIRELWLALDGPECCMQITDHHDALRFFSVFEDYYTDCIAQGISFAPDQFLKYLNKFHVASANQHASLQIMTIHKAKGLEFDHVYFIGLERPAAQDSKQILLWQERAHSLTRTDLILAPIANVESPNEPIYQFLRQQIKHKQVYEDIRLLYVALTRAKESVNFFVTLPELNSTPQKNTLLAFLWTYLQNKANVQVAEAYHISQRPVHLIRLEQITRVKPLPVTSTYISSALSLPEKQTHQAIGILIHEILCHLADKPLPTLKDFLIHHANYCKHRLLEEGIVSQALEEAYEEVVQCLQQLLQDERAHWILAGDHHLAVSEFAMLDFSENSPREIIIDRSFICKETDVRYVIDYKTTPLTNNMHSFYREAKLQYQQQLERYAKAWQVYDAKYHQKSYPIHLALYFPRFAGWHCWEFNPDLALISAKEAIH